MFASLLCELVYGGGGRVHTGELEASAANAALVPFTLPSRRDPTVMSRQLRQASAWERLASLEQLLRQRNPMKSDSGTASADANSEETKGASPARFQATSIAEEAETEADTGDPHTSKNCPFRPARCIEAFRVLQTLFLQTDSDALQHACLAHLLQVFNDHPQNYLCLSQENTLTLLIEQLPHKTESLQSFVVTVLASVLRSPRIDWVPFQELCQLLMVLTQQTSEQKQPSTGPVADGLKHMFSQVVRLCVQVGVCAHS